MIPDVVRLDGRMLTTKASFHDAFAEAMGFPAFYGRNMDAWIDCMGSIDDPASGLSEVRVPPGSVLTLHIENYKELKAASPLIVEELYECAAFVNWRRVSEGGAPLLALAFNG